MLVRRILSENIRRAFPALAVALAVWLGVAAPRTAVAQNSYGQYYQQNVQRYGGQLGTQSTSRYLYDKYFYDTPAVSPYANINRLDTMSGTAYQAYVRPEQQRRTATMASQSAYIAARKREGRVGETRFPGATYGQAGTAYLKPVPQRRSTPSAYYNHWYGGWKGR